MTETCLAPDLVAAYRATDYHVTGATPDFVLNVGIRSPALAALLVQCGCDCAAVLTAYNPASIPRDAARNAAAQARLGERIASLDLPRIDAHGADPTGAWPAEASVFVPGLSRADAIELAREFGQNALVWSGADAIPQLVLLR